MVSSFVFMTSRRACNALKVRVLETYERAVLTKVRRASSYIFYDFRVELTSSSHEASKSFLVHLSRLQSLLKSESHTKIGDDDSFARCSYYADSFLLLLFFNFQHGFIPLATLIPAVFMYCMQFRCNTSVIGVVMSGQDFTYEMYWPAWLLATRYYQWKPVIFRGECSCSSVAVKIGTNHVSWWSISPTRLISAAYKSSATSYWFVIAIAENDDDEASFQRHASIITNHFTIYIGTVFWIRMMNNASTEESTL